MRLQTEQQIEASYCGQRQHNAGNPGKRRICPPQLVYLLVASCHPQQSQVPMAIAPSAAHGGAIAMQMRMRCWISGAQLHRGSAPPTFCGVCPHVRLDMQAHPSCAHMSALQREIALTRSPGLNAPQSKCISGGCESSTKRKFSAPRYHSVTSSTASRINANVNCLIF